MPHKRGYGNIPDAISRGSFPVWRRYIEIQSTKEAVAPEVLQSDSEFSFLHMSWISHYCKISHDYHWRICQVLRYSIETWSVILRATHFLLLTWLWNLYDPQHSMTHQTFTINKNCRLLRTAIQVGHLLGYWQWYRWQHLKKYQLYIYFCYYTHGFKFDVTVACIVICIGIILWKKELKRL